MRQRVRERGREREREYKQLKRVENINSIKEKKH